MTLSQLRCILPHTKVVEHTIPCVERLQKTFAQKAAEFKDVVKLVVLT